jgi:hypothetical protein
MWYKITAVWLLIGMPSCGINSSIYSRNCCNFMITSNTFTSLSYLFYSNTSNLLGKIWLQTIMICCGIDFSIYTRNFQYVQQSKRSIAVAAAINLQDLREVTAAYINVLEQQTHQRQMSLQQVQQSDGHDMDYIEFAPNDPALTELTQFNPGLSDRDWAKAGWGWVLGGVVCYHGGMNANDRSKAQS